jgi:hypothetical protein
MHTCSAASYALVGEDDGLTDAQRAKQARRRRRQKKLVDKQLAEKEAARWRRIVRRAEMEASREEHNAKMEALKRKRWSRVNKVNKGGTGKFCIGILIIIAAVVLLVCTGLGSTVARRRMCRRAWYSWDRAVWCRWGHGATVISEYEQFRGLCNMTSTGNVTAVENWISRHSDQRHMLGMACPAPFRYMLIFQWKTQRTHVHAGGPTIH